MYSHSLGLLLLRLVPGMLLLVVHCRHKIAGAIAYLRSGTPWPLVAEVAAIRFPFPLASALFATVMQTLGAVGIVLGVQTQIAALALVAVLLVALYTDIVTGEDPQLALLYLVSVAAVGLLGPGQWSLDAAMVASLSSPAAH